MSFQTDTNSVKFATVFYLFFYNKYFTILQNYILNEIKCLNFTIKTQIFII